MAEIRQKPTQQSSSGTSGATSPGKGSSFSGCKFFCKFLLVTTGIYLALWGLTYLPSPIDPVPITFPTLNDFVERNDVNDDLTKAKHLFKYEVESPQAIVVDEEGNLYAGLSDGQIIEFTNEKFKTISRLGKPPYNLCSQPTTKHICGYISGMSGDPNNSSVLYIADYYHGIFKLDLKAEGRMVSVVDSNVPITDVPPMRQISDLTVLSNGSIFFIDASSKFGVNDSFYEVLEGRANGKLLHYNPVDKSVQMVASGLHFPNGLCASHDESFLLVADTTRARILKFNLQGPHAGKMKTFADNLPGLPCKITRSSQGGFWVGFSLSRMRGRLDGFYRTSRLRTLLVNLGLTNYLMGSYQLDGIVVELDGEGGVTRWLYDKEGAMIGDVTGALQVGSSLYLASRTNPFIGFLETVQ